MRNNAVESYLGPRATCKSPFFLFIGDEEYLSTKDYLHQNKLEIIPMSQFCGSSDKIPNIDDLVAYIEESDINTNSKRFVIVGLGEFLGLMGAVFAEDSLRRLFRCNVGGSKVVLLLRGVKTQVENLRIDQRFDERCHAVINNAASDISFTLISSSLGATKIDGFKDLLLELETGRSGNITASTSVEIDDPLYNVRRVSSAYAGVIFHVQNFPLSETSGTQENWLKLLTQLIETDGSLDTVFKKYNFAMIQDRNIRKHLSQASYENWMFFVYLKYNMASIQNAYLKYVLGETINYTSFSSNLLKAIIDILPNDARFDLYWKERKELVANFSDHEISDFILSNRENEADSVYRLTDNTLEERKEIIDWIARNKTIPKIIENIYPQLALYLKTYVFKYPDEELSNLLTKYFEKYKTQKIKNLLDDNFLETVNAFAIERKYTGLPSHSEVLDKIAKRGTKLYWLDALGVEYLAYIENLAKDMGLSISISIVQTELPSITTKNNSFFYDWPNDQRYEKNSDLDDIKHHKSGGYSFEENKNPIHVARELDIVKEVMTFAATELKSKKCARLLIVSDHGASRLAVLCQKEEHIEVKYDTDTKPEASGRCCKLPEQYDQSLPFAAIEDGYLVLADYGRFKGSRRANVEVHGGASLEEVVVPIIVLSLRESKIIVKLLYPKGANYYIVDNKTGGTINFFFNAPAKDVTVVFADKVHYAEQTTSDQHFSVALPELKRAGSYEADVYVDGDSVDTVTIVAQGKSGKVDQAFDDLF